MYMEGGGGGHTHTSFSHTSAPTQRHFAAVKSWKGTGGGTWNADEK